MRVVLTSVAAIAIATNVFSTPAIRADEGKGAQPISPGETAGSGGHHHHHHHWHGGICGDAIWIAPGPFVPGPIYSVYPYPLFAPSLYLPAEMLFGPLAAMRFMNVAPPGPLVRPDPIKELAEEEIKPNRRTSPESIARGWQFIGYGDRYFAEQRYNEAYQRYKLAAGAAPEIAASQFRQAYALIAMGRYALAAKAMKRGIALEPDWPESDFNVDQLYGRNRLAREAHIDGLAAEATNDPFNAELLFLLGVLLYFDNQHERARLFLNRAAELTGADDSHLKPFLVALDKRRA